MRHCKGPFVLRPRQQRMLWCVRTGDLQAMRKPTLETQKSNKLNVEFF
jgi:hypothetical protein